MAEQMIHTSFLVLGGARSGKTRHALAMAASLCKKKNLSRKIYLATAQPRDEEMRTRIAHHIQEREGLGWETVEEPLDLVSALLTQSSQNMVLLVDCLTLWLSNLMEAGRDIRSETRKLQEILPELEGPVIFVSNEVGLGIVPMTELGRMFRDEQGRFNQALAQIIDQVDFMVAGLPMRVKG